MDAKIELAVTESLETIGVPGLDMNDLRRNHARARRQRLALLCIGSTMTVIAAATAFALLSDTPERGSDAIDPASPIESEPQVVPPSSEDVRRCLDNAGASTSPTYRNTYPGVADPTAHIQGILDAQLRTGAPRNGVLDAERGDTATLVEEGETRVVVAVVRADSSISSVVTFRSRAHAWIPDDFVSCAR